MGAALNAFERRMVEVAKAVVGAPRIVLLDEPGAGLAAAGAGGAARRRSSASTRASGR